MIEPLNSIYRGLDKYANILKTVSPLNLHITMKFLGDVDEDKCLKMINAFNILEGFERIDYTLKGLGCFPSLSAPSVIWAGIECDMKKISDVFSKAEEFCSSFGFEKETRRFVPHLTIARVRRGKDVPAGIKEFIKSNKEKVYGESVFNRLVLFESRLDKSGPEYTNLTEVGFI
jgi:2'-5' RNA ligase